MNIGRVATAPESWTDRWTRLQVWSLEKSQMVDYAVLALAIIAGGVLRLWQLDAVGFNSDEAVYAGQAAAIAGDEELSEFFPMFRAHPLLFQFTYALFFPLVSGENVDNLGRTISAAMGLIALVLVFFAGRNLYGRRIGAVAALLVGLMPYHVVVSRQVLLDGPMTMFAMLTLLMLVQFGRTERPGWLYAAGASMGLTVLAKEPSIILLASIYAFLALSPEIKVRVRDLIASGFFMALVIAPFPISMAIAGGGGSTTAHQYLVWQLFRRPNHVWSFYPTTVPFAIGPLIILIAVVGIVMLRYSFSWREKLLLSWIVVPIVFFQMWPTKGFQYLLPIAPALAILAARALIVWLPTAKFLRPLSRRGRRRFVAMVIAVVAISIAVPSWQRIQPSGSGTFLAGTGGVPGGREAGEWIRYNTPEGAEFMTIGPSMANIVQFYGHRHALGLAVSPNPLHRNPSYEPIINPDFQLRNGNLQYIVWDSYSAGRSSFFSNKVIGYARRYNGRVVHTESVKSTTPSGDVVQSPVIIIYEVRP